MLNKNAMQSAINDEKIYVDNVIGNVGENSIYVTLGDTLKVYDSPTLDAKTESPTRTIIIPKDGLLLQPGKLYLGRTNEYTKTYGYVPLLSGLEDLAMIGMKIHITAGFGDNGFEGTWTLEIICANPTLIFSGMTIGAISYFPLIGDATIEYRGKYFQQVDPTASRLSQEYPEDTTKTLNLGSK